MRGSIVEVILIFKLKTNEPQEKTTHNKHISIQQDYRYAAVQLKPELLPKLQQLQH